MKKRWKSSEGTITNLYYHLLWCPKYQRDVLKDEIAKRLIELLEEKSKEIEVPIISYEIMPDCVHLLVKANAEDSPHFIIQQFKSYTSKILREEFKILRSRIPTLWTRNYYCSSVGRLNEEEINDFLNKQGNV